MKRDYYFFFLKVTAQLNIINKIISLKYKILIRCTSISWTTKYITKNKLLGYNILYFNTIKCLSKTFNKLYFVMVSTYHSTKYYTDIFNVILSVWPWYDVRNVNSSTDTTESLARLYNRLFIIFIFNDL